MRHKGRTTCSAAWDNAQWHHLGTLSVRSETFIGWEFSPQVRVGVSDHTNDLMPPILSKILLIYYFFFNLVKFSYLCGFSGSEEKTLSLFWPFHLCCLLFTVLAVLGVHLGSSSQGSGFLPAGHGQVPLRQPPSPWGRWCRQGAQVLTSACLIASAGPSPALPTMGVIHLFLWGWLQVGGRRVLGHIIIKTPGRF